MNETASRWKRRIAAAVDRRLLRSRLLGLVPRDHLVHRLPGAVADSVALTFDDGPHPDATPRILDLLAEYNASATFFVVGENALQFPELLRRMVAERHTVGNHTHRHVRVSRLAGPEVQAELSDASTAIRTACMEAAANLFRPPYGSIRAVQAWSLVRRGWKVVLWSMDPRDYDSGGPARVKAVGDTACGGDIILLHDYCHADTAALRVLLERLSSRGLRSVAIPEGAAQPLRVQRASHVRRLQGYLPWV